MPKPVSGSVSRTAFSIFYRMFATADIRSH